MRHFLFLLLLVALTGCASKGDLLERQVSPPQNYRMADGEVVKISGKMERKYRGFTLGDESYRVISVFFNDTLALESAVNAQYVGEFVGTWNDRKISADCTSRIASKNWRDVRCMIFIDNERTVTLTF